MFSVFPFLFRLFLFPPYAQTLDRQRRGLRAWCEILMRSRSGSSRRRTGCTVLPASSSTGIHCIFSPAVAPVVVIIFCGSSLFPLHHVVSGCLLAAVRLLFLPSAAAAAARLITSDEEEYELQHHHSYSWGRILMLPELHLR